MNNGRRTHLLELAGAVAVGLPFLDGVVAASDVHVASVAALQR